MERYYRIARKGTKTIQPYYEFECQADMQNDWWEYADDLIVAQFGLEEDINPEAYEIALNDILDSWLEQSKAEFEIDDETVRHIYGGIDIGDYTYYTINVNDDESNFVSMQDIGRSN